MWSVACEHNPWEDKRRGAQGEEKRSKSHPQKQQRSGWVELWSHTVTCCHAKEMPVASFETSEGESDARVELCGVAYFPSIPQDWNWHAASSLFPTLEVWGAAGRAAVPELGLQGCGWTTLTQEATVSIAVLRERWFSTMLRNETLQEADLL